MVSQPAPRVAATTAVWRWHGIAGLLAAPVLLLLALTGAVYLFRWEVDRWQRPELFAAVDGPYLPLSAQVAAAQMAVPEATPLRLALDPECNWPTEIVLGQLDGSEVTAVVDPTTAHVRGFITDDARWSQLAIHLHRDLFAGTAGRYVLELAASWGAILLISGIFLWWPRGGQTLLAAVVPRRGGGLRHWHVVPALWLTAPALFLVLSGLPWTVVWGDLHDRTTAALGSGFPSEVFWQRPTSQEAANQHPLTLDAVVDSVADRPLPQAREIVFPRTAGETWIIHGQMGHDPLLWRWSFVDPHSGAVVLDRSWSDIGLLARPAALGVSLHMGLFFGPLNRALSLAGCLGMAAMAITGPLLWWRRRATGMRLPAVQLSQAPRCLLLLAGLVLACLPVAAVGTLVVATASWAWRSAARR